MAPLVWRPWFGVGRGGRCSVSPDVALALLREASRADMGAEPAASDETAIPRWNVDLGGRVRFRRLGHKESWYIPATVSDPIAEE